MRVDVEPLMPDRSMSVAERAARGKATRTIMPLAAHAEFDPSADRDVVTILQGQDAGREPTLVPVRYGRMLVSPFTFFRGAAAVMAADLGAQPTSGLRTQLCGDAHLSNFGGYASADRRLVFDINDFDETLPGPFEWDVKRLAASLVVAGRNNGFDDFVCHDLARDSVQRYRTAMRTFGGQSILDVWYAHLDIDVAAARFISSLDSKQRKRSKAELKATTSLIGKARSRDSQQAIRKLTTSTAGGRRIVNAPPLVTPITEFVPADAEVATRSVEALLTRYRETLQADRRHLFDHFELTDIAHKVVGVGSVGLRAWILLLESDIDTGGLLLQAKQAGRSVLADHVGESQHTAHGERVVAGQRLMQASSDIFLGWLHSDGFAEQRVDYYVRQLRDWKLSAEVDAMSPTSMLRYARMCGWTLARAHARAGDRVAIAAYVGKSDRFDRAVADFALAYADQNDRDYDTLLTAVDTGRVAVRRGV